MEEHMLFENIDEKLEEDASIITAKWVALNFDLKIQDSERLLTSYFNNRPGLFAVYTVTGLCSSGELKARLCSSERLAEIREQFTYLPIEKIYSVQRTPCKCSSTLASVDPLLDINVESLKKLVSIPWEPLKPVRPPLASCENVQKTEKTQTSTVISRLNIDGKDKQIMTKSAKNFFTAAPKQSTVTSKSEPKPPAKRPSNFLDTHPSNTPCQSEEQVEVTNPELVNQGEEEEEFLSSAVRASSAKRKRLVLESDDEDDEELWHSVKHELKPKTTTASKKPSIPSSDNKTSVRTKILAVDSETESPKVKPNRAGRSRKNLDKNDAKNPEQPASPIPSRQPTLSSQPLTSAAPDRSTEKKSNRVRRQVMKTFTDEDGFMVTEKVWESASDTDEGNVHSINEPSEDLHKPPLKPATAGLTAKPTLGSMKKQQPASKPGGLKPATKQASLSAFFKKN